jgi:MATE family multidrug resistance protein
MPLPPCSPQMFAACSAPNRTPSAMPTLARPLARPLADDARATLRLALPLIAGQLASFSWSIVDIVLAGHLGADVLGAVAIGSNIFGLAIMAILGVMLAVPPIVSQLDGAGRRSETAFIFRQAAWLGLGLGAVLGALTWVAGTRLAALAGIAPTTLPAVDGFLTAVCLGAPAFGLFSACRGLADGLSMPRVTLAFCVLGLCVLTPLAWVLMYGKLGVPALGAIGCGMATAIALWVQALAFWSWLRLSRRTADLGWQDPRIAPDPAQLARLLRLGVPMAVAVVLEIGLFTAAALLIGSLGEVAVAAHQIALNVAAVAFMVPMGVGMAITVRVGNAVGRGDAEAMRRAGLVGICLAFAVEIVACTLMLAVPGPIIALYTSDAAVHASAVALLFYAALFQFSDGVQVASAGALRGLKDTRAPMFVTAFAYWGIGMPVGWTLGFPYGLGAAGMWIGLILGLTVAAVLLFARFVVLSRRGLPAG